METSDAQDRMVEVRADIEDMDEEIGQLAYQQQEIEARV